MAEVGFKDMPRAIIQGAEWKEAKDEDEKAMAIACAVIDLYGDLLPHEWDEFRRERKIYRDHCAYQAALAALRIAKAESADR